MEQILVMLSLMSVMIEVEYSILLSLMLTFEIRMLLLATVTQ
jgi:hypothetical protein